MEKSPLSTGMPFGALRSPAYLVEAAERVRWQGCQQPGGESPLGLPPEDFPAGTATLGLFSSIGQMKDFK